MADNDSRSFEDQAKLEGSPAGEMLGKMTGQGNFKDTGRQSSGWGESLDSAVGVPIRTAIDQAQQGNFNAEGALNVLRSIGGDPQAHPTGVDIAQRATDNPYLGAAMATAVDVGSQLPAAEMMAGRLPGVAGTVAESQFKAPTMTELPELVAQHKAEANALADQLGAAHPKAQLAQGRYNTLNDRLQNQLANSQAMPRKSYADGGEVDAFDALPSTPDEAMAQIHQPTPEVAGPTMPQQQPQAMAPDVHPTMSFDELQAENEKYDTLGQQAIAGLEGVGKGVAGPLAPLAEKAFGVPEEDIRGREAANPITHGLGQAVGLGGGMLLGTGEGQLLLKTGELATEAAGLAAPVSFAAKVGSAAVQQAAEMAVLQSGDEISKQILNDPDASTQSAIANIGMAAALGGAGGAFVTGAISPLWHATVGEPVANALNKVVNHLNGAKGIVPEEVHAAAQTLGINLEPELKAAIGTPKGAEYFNELREAQHPRIKEVLENIHRDIDDAVAQTLPKAPEEIANYSEAEGGRHAMGTFEREYKAKYEPISKEFNQITEPFKEAPVMPSQRATMADKIANMAQEKGYIGADIPQNKVVNSILNRIEGLKTAEDFMRLNTTVDRITNGDANLMGVAYDLKAIINDYHSNTIGMAIGREAPELMARYTAAKAAYAKLANISTEIGNELNLGKFKGPGTLLARLASKRSPEQFLNKLSPKGNAEILKFLGQHFPETLESIRDSEMSRILKPAVLSAKGESAINHKTLQSAIEKGMAGQRERMMFALPERTIAATKAADTIRNAIPEFKSSGTAGWLQKLTAYIPASASAMITGLMGHNPAVGYLTGHLTKLLGVDAPQAMKLALLKVLASEQAIQAPAFKSMVEFLHNSIKGQTLLNKATGAMFKAGVEVLTDKQMPNKADREKLDKIVSTVQANPEHMASKLLQGQTGHYLPQHQAAMTQSVTNAINYLQSIKPGDSKSGPLDKAQPPLPMDVTRYNRALDIANQPAIVLQHIKDGNLQQTDIQDLQAMYPGYAQQMSAKIQNSLTSVSAKDEHIPYKTRMGISMLLGQPLDATMSPQSIQAAQMAIMKPQQQPQGPQSKPPPVSATNKLGKSIKNTMTASQSAESDRSNGRT